MAEPTKTATLAFGDKVIDLPVHAFGEVRRRAEHLSKLDRIGFAVVPGEIRECAADVDGNAQILDHRYSQPLSASSAGP